MGFRSKPQILKVHAPGESFWLDRVVFEKDKLVTGYVNNHLINEDNGYVFGDKVSAEFIDGRWEVMQKLEKLKVIK